MILDENTLQYKYSKFLIKHPENNMWRLPYMHIV